jgi:hypothetical protein
LNTYSAAVWEFPEAWDCWEKLLLRAVALPAVGALSSAIVMLLVRSVRLSK